MEVKEQQPQERHYKTYLGTKLVKATPALADRQMGSYPEGSEGYKVVYSDGYFSWSPKEVFEESYRPIDGLTFGDAIEAMRIGKKVARAGWNGKGMWLSLSCPETREVPAGGFWSDNNAKYAAEQGGTAKVLPCITMKTATGEILMGWLASQSDILAQDYCVVE